MSPVILFSLLLILCFGVLLYFLKPTRTETAVERHLADIEGDRAVSAGATILREEKLSSMPWLHQLLRQVPGSLALVRLIKQAGSRRRMASIVLFSLLGVPSPGGWRLSGFQALLCARAPGRPWAFRLTCISMGCGKRDSGAVRLCFPRRST